MSASRLRGPCRRSGRDAHQQAFFAGHAAQPIHNPSTRTCNPDGMRFK